MGDLIGAFMLGAGLNIALGVVGSVLLGTRLSYPAANVPAIHARNAARQLANKQRVAAILASRRRRGLGYGPP